MIIIPKVIARMFRRGSPDPTDDFWYMPAMGETQAGVDVNQETALVHPAVFACVKIIAEAIASLPLLVYRRNDESKERAPDHRLYPLLHDSPNGEQTSCEWREQMVGHLLLWGNAYSWIELDSFGAKSLWPLNPARVTPKRDEEGNRVYEYSPQAGSLRVFPARQILHFRAFSTDGITGKSPITLARECIALGLSAQTYGARLFRNGVQFSGALSHPGRISEVAHERLKESLERKYSGPTNAWRPFILEEGMKWENTGMPAKDAQWIDLRKFQTLDIARIYRIPPHMVGDLDRATFSNIEQQSLEFVVYTLMPWLVRIEQRLSLTLMSEKERRNYYIKFLVDGLLRGDIKSRYDAYAVGRQWGWLSANDIRRLEDMNPIEDGDNYLTPLNMISADASSGPSEVNDEKANEEGAARASHRDLGRKLGWAPHEVKAKSRR
jgi:HK97 family phage portal protein